MEACKCWSFLRPLCGCKKPSESRKLAEPIARRTAMWLTLHPHHSPFHWPHTPCTNHTSHFPSVPLLPDYTPLDCSLPPIWQCQAPHLHSHFPSLTLCPSIESVSTPSVFAAWPVGVNGSTACQIHAVFINTPDSLGLLCVSLAVCKVPFQLCQSTKLPLKLNWRKLTRPAHQLFSYLLTHEFWNIAFIKQKCWDVWVQSWV